MNGVVGAEEVVHEAVANVEDEIEHEEAEQDLHGEGELLDEPCQRLLREVTLEEELDEQVMLERQEWHEEDGVEDGPAQLAPELALEEGPFLVDDAPVGVVFLDEEPFDALEDLEKEHGDDAHAEEQIEGIERALHVGLGKLRGCGDECLEHGFGVSFRDEECAHAGANAAA